MEWNDLQLVLAVAEGGGLLGAARVLDVHPTTISRRLKALERDHGVRLFEKYRHGVVLTEAGAEAVEVARQVRELTVDLSARLDGRDTALRGTVRLTAVGPLLRRWMSDFAAFQQRYPEIQLECVQGLDLVNLTQRDADVAVRIAADVPGHLVGARMCDVAHAIYASHDLIERVGIDTALNDWPWVSYDLAVYRGVDLFLSEHYPGARVVMRVPDIDLLAHALTSGVGVGVMQCILGDADPQLRRLALFSSSEQVALWVLTHPQLRGTARVSVFMRFLRQLIERDRDRFEGRGG